MSNLHQSNLPLPHKRSGLVLITCPRDPFPDEDMTSMHMAKHGEWSDDEGDLQGFPTQLEGPKLIRFESPRWRPKNNSSSSPPQSPQAARTKNNAQVAHGVYFRRSLYRWKDNFKELPMALVSGPNSLGVNRNSRNNVTSRICQGAAPPSFGLLSHVPCQAKWPKWWTPP